MRVPSPTNSTAISRTPNGPPTTVESFSVTTSTAIPRSVSIPWMAHSRIETDLGIAVLVVTEKDSTVVGGPLGVLDIAVEFVGEGMRIAPVAIHEGKLGGLMALVAIIVTSVGDEFPVGRHGGGGVRGLCVC